MAFHRYSEGMWEKTLEIVELEQRLPLTAKFIDMTGWEHDGIRVLSFAGWRDKCAVWNIVCDRCGNERRFWGALLRHWGSGRRDRRPACKCKTAERELHRSREWHVWSYINRTYDVCVRWSEFANFQEDMGTAPEGKQNLGRKNPKAAYSKENCFWCDRQSATTAALQRLFTFNGETKNITQWAATLGISKERMRQRFRDYTIHDALVYDRDERLRSRARIPAMANVGQYDHLITDAINNPAKGRLLRRGEHFEGVLSAARNKITTRASHLGVNITTRVNDDDSFWIVSFPKVDHADIQSEFHHVENSAVAP